MNQSTSLRLILGWHLLVYCVWWALSLFFAAGGHGSLLPFALFWGRAVVANRALQPWLGNGEALVFVLAATQLTACGLAWWLLRRKGLGWRFLIPIPLAQLAGTFLMVWQQPLEELRFLAKYPATAVISWLSAILAFAAYWSISFRRLAKKRE